MSIFWRKIEKSLDGCPIRNAGNRQIEQFWEKKEQLHPGRWSCWFRSCMSLLTLHGGFRTIMAITTKRNDRPQSPNGGGHSFWPYAGEELAVCTDSAFPYLYYRRQHADCQAPEGIAIRRFLWYPYLQERRCSASAAVMLPSSVSLFASSAGGSPIFCQPPEGSIVFTWDTWRRIPSWKF